ncbi:MAG: cell division protein FtsQ/DivIB [Aestuariivirga sp.]|uniref:cell division protein FtsQ/DivIB n=1 Tax=Aestuariivirga sp. TaxID=2650926 RepID=UPI0025C556EC|nr:cell division protein FtsQ/DivIB [Aestuariivirga sp.]MCA3560416.1 cell division protein FtsQ/DivIB [Aestuariivirga sp.]
MTRDAAVYARRRRSWLDQGDSFKLRVLTRASALLMLGGVIMSGLVNGGHLAYDGSPWLLLPGKAAGMAGMAAQEITITGLEHHEPETLLSAIGVEPGGSLMGFDAIQARNILQNLDWVQSAKVQRLFPNQLVVEVKEREPFAIWQRGTAYYVIDKAGAAMSGLEASQMVRLPLVTGEGANAAAAELINQLAAYPELMLQVKASARVGSRRWTLYLDNGITVQLPERDWRQAIATADQLNKTQRILARGIRSLDLRLPGRVTVEVADSAAAGAQPANKKTVAGAN